MPLKIKTTRNYKQTKRYFLEAKKTAKLDDIQKVADKTVKKLRDVSTYDSIAIGWSYEIVQSSRGIELYFLNSLVENDTNIAVVVDQGYTSKEGRWVEGKDYISEPVLEAYNKILNDTWKELQEI